MKRSDMIMELSISLMSRLPEWTRESRLEFASELLGDLEIAGMLPPYNKNHGIDNYSLAMGVGVEATHTWEDEESLILSEGDYEKVLSEIDNPSEPNEYLVNAFKVSEDENEKK